MSATHSDHDNLHLVTSLAWAKGAYTVSIAFGSGQRRANLLLDTGSSTLAVLPHAYTPASDSDLSATSWVQQLRYGIGRWSGPIVRTNLAFGEGVHACTVEAAEVALVESGTVNFRDADGIFGLAYAGLDVARDLHAYLCERGVVPPLSWPWPFDASQAETDSLEKALPAQPRVDLQPLFSQMAGQGLVQNRFGLRVLRAVVHVSDDTLDDAALDADPLNRGVLVLGGGEHARELHSGVFQSVRIVHDLYYNANLIALKVGDRPRIAVPPLDAQYANRAASNAILDTGCSFLVLEAQTYQAVMADLGAIDARMPQCCEQFAAAYRDGERGIPNAQVDALNWPTLTFVLEGERGEEVELPCPPQNYWPRNAMRAGEAWFLLMSQLSGWPNQSILGLPLMAGHFCLFDRSGGNGLGRVQIAPALTEPTPT